MDDLQSGTNDLDGKDLLTGVAAMEHKSADQALNNGALHFAEALLGVTGLRVRQVDWVLVGNVVFQRNIVDFKTFEGPLVEQFWLGGEISHGKCAVYVSDLRNSYDGGCPGSRSPSPPS